MKTPEQLASMIRNKPFQGAKRGEEAICPVCDEIFIGQRKPRQVTCCKNHAHIYKAAIVIFNRQNKKNMEDMFESLAPEMDDGNSKRWLSVCGEYVRGCDNILGF